MESLLATWSPIAIISFALAPIFIAAIALGLSIWAGREQRKHNKLSVKPFLDILADDKRIHIENVGLGPARITSIEAIVDDEETFYFDSFEGGYNCMLKLFPNTEIEEKVDRFHTYDNTQVLPGKYRDLVRFNKDRDPGEVVSAVTRLKITVHYESMYNEKMEPAVYPGSTHQGFPLQDQEEQDS